MKLANREEEEEKSNYNDHTNNIIEKYIQAHTEQTKILARVIMKRAYLRFCKSYLTK
jgi:hypothetical protein